MQAGLLVNSFIALGNHAWVVNKVQSIFVFPFHFIFFVGIFQLWKIGGIHRNFKSVNSGEKASTGNACGSGVYDTHFTTDSYKM